jgi:hypothetical protein
MIQSTSRPVQLAISLLAAVVLEGCDSAAPPSPYEALPQVLESAGDQVLPTIDPNGRVRPSKGTLANTYHGGMTIVMKSQIVSQLGLSDMLTIPVWCRIAEQNNVPILEGWRMLAESSPADAVKQILESDGR